MTQKSAAALQITETLDVQRPNVGTWIAISHPFSQISEHKKYRSSKKNWSKNKILRNTAEFWNEFSAFRTCQPLLQKTDPRSSCLPGQSSRALLESRPWGSACLGWRIRGSSPADGSHMSPGSAFSLAGRLTWVLEKDLDRKYRL